MTGNTRIDLKVVLLGKECVGKTALADRFLHARFLAAVPYQNTIGAAFGSRVVTCDCAPAAAAAASVDGGGKRDLVLGVWDTAGSERYESMARMYYRGAGAAIICYDVTDSTSLVKAKFWASELRRHEPASCRLYLCGCKRDLAVAEPALRQVEQAEAAHLAGSIGAGVFETSSLTGENVDDLFRQVAEDFASGAGREVADGGGGGGGGAQASFSLESSKRAPSASGGWVTSGRCFCFH